MHVVNPFSVVVMINVWERKFVYYSVDTWFAMWSETEGIPIL